MENMCDKKILDIPEKILLEIYSDLAKPGVQQVGQALGDILSIFNLISIPFKLLNERGNIWLNQNLDRYRKKMSLIDSEEVQYPLPEIAIPVIEKMIYTTCSELGEMFANLLKNASTKKGVDKAHPNFVNIISSISRDEAIILEDFYKKNSSIPSLFLKRSYKDNKWNTPITCFTHYHNDDRLDFPRNNGFYFENLESLGVIYKSKASLSNSRYDKLKMELNAIIDTIKEGKGETYHKIENHIGVSEFGKLFLRAVFE